MLTNLGQISQILGSRKRRVITEAGRPRACVLVLLYNPPPDYQLIYTLRTQKVEHHKGEISFPGGVQDPEDQSLIHTALREAWEEVGLRSEDVNVLGLLDDIVTRSNFVVTPVLGRIEPSPYRFIVSEQEVAELLKVPLSHLTDPRNHVPHPDYPNDPSKAFPSYKFRQHVIFGATALMTNELLKLLKER